MSGRRRIYLVRHGEASAKWTEADDPGLSDHGAAQARAAADRLGALEPFAILSSPQKRARETAAPLCKRWARIARIEPAVTELPSPGVPLADRQRWLLEIMQGGWDGAGNTQQAWRNDLIRTLVAQREDCAIFSHFVAINAAVGAATGEDRVILFRPANASVTVIETDGERLFLIERGEEATTRVN